MLYCPDCHAEIEFEEADLEEGAVVDCSGCGILLEVVAVGPVEFEEYDVETDDSLEWMED